MGVFTDIESALQTKLNSVSGAPTIAWENTKEYIPVLGTRFWRPTHLPAGSVLATANAGMKHLGIYQVDVYVPVKKGLKTLLADLDAIYAAFNTVTSLTGGSNRIDILEVSRGRVVREEAWCHGFIQINYMCYS